MDSGKRMVTRLVGGLMALQSLAMYEYVASTPLTQPVQAVAAPKIKPPTQVLAKVVEAPPPPAAIPSEVSKPACVPSAIAWLPETVARWHPYVAATAEKFALPPAILDILMTFESLGHPTIVSRVGAVGLVQIMPTTAPGLEAQLGLPPQNLNDPPTNIYLSGKYVRNVLDSGVVDMSQGFTSEVAKQVAVAYNGGMNSLVKYRTTGQIPFEETQHYAARVASAWNEQSLPVSPTLNEYMTYPGPQRLVAEAAGIGTPPC